MQKDPTLVKAEWQVKVQTASQAVNNNISTLTLEALNLITLVKETMFKGESIPEPYTQPVAHLQQLLS